jgi:NAD kinase
MATPRLVIVHRRTELQELLDRHATRGQAEFFLRTRGRNIQDVQDRHDRLTAALASLRAAVPAEWRHAEVERADLSRFLLTPEDIIAVVGQDGLVANAAKYLNGQPVIGINPEPGVNPGILVRHSPESAARLLQDAAQAGPAQRLRCHGLTTVTARLDDGQELSGLNEVFIGHASHQSARYQLTTPDGQAERHSLSPPARARRAGAHRSPSNAEDAHCQRRRIHAWHGSSAKPGPPLLRESR